jgi:Holliday junction DNA helicase RuvA
MIGFLEGRLHQLDPGEVIVEANGVGYLVQTTLRAFQRLSRAQHAKLWIHTLVRSDAISLFGFLDREEQGAFERLIAVAGVGPRTALAVLSGLSPGELAEAVEAGDAAQLQRVPGVGRKTADRIVLELRGRLPRGPSDRPDALSDAVSALVNLGYKERDARRAVEKVGAIDGEPDLAQLLREALRYLTGMR